MTIIIYFKIAISHLFWLWRKQVQNKQGKGGHGGGVCAVSVTSLFKFYYR